MKRKWIGIAILVILVIMLAMNTTVMAKQEIEGLEAYQLALQSVVATAQAG
jgi:type II secretory pathway pseudopilin PulG